jgi:hypothetical protein
MLIYILPTPKIHEALYYAESKDKYNRACGESRKNADARQGMNYTAAALTDVDFNMYNQLFKEYIRFVPQRLLRDIDYASIAILMPSADNGFPHTRPDRLVCFPQSASLPPLETFIHELWHIHQRAHRDLWHRLYTVTWGFKPWNSEGIPEELRSQIRINPDTMMYGLYCWRDEWVPLPIYNSPTRPRMNDCSVWFLNVKTGRWRQTVPEAWAEYFSHPMIPASAHEHPNELSAYMLSLLGHDMRGPPAFVALKSAVGMTSFFVKA